MKSQNSEIYFILQDISHYWYGKYDYTINTFSWSAVANNVQTIKFMLIKSSEPSIITFEQLAEKFPIIYQQSTPFDLAYLQTHYPELLI